MVANANWLPKKVPWFLVLSLYTREITATFRPWNFSRQYIFVFCIAITIIIMYPIICCELSEFLSSKFITFILGIVHVYIAWEETAAQRYGEWLGCKESQTITGYCAFHRRTLQVEDAARHRYTWVFDSIATIILRYWLSGVLYSPNYYLWKGNRQNCG